MGELGRSPYHDFVSPPQPCPPIKISKKQKGRQYLIVLEELPIVKNSPSLVNLPRKPCRLKAECHRILLLDELNIIQINQIVTNLLNLHKTYKIENKNVECGKFYRVGIVKIRDPMFCYSLIPLFCNWMVNPLVETCIVMVSKIWILRNILGIPDFKILVHKLQFFLES